MYRAQARLLIEDERSAEAGFQNVETGYRDPEPYYQTQYRILRGRELARKVIKKLNLATIPEFSGHAPRPNRFARLVSSFRAAVSEQIPALVTRTPIAEIPTAVDSAGESALVAGFLSRIEVKPVRNSRLVDVYFEGADPAFATRALNLLVEEYVQQNLDFKLQATDKTLTWLADELAKQQRKVEDSERALAQYREQQNALSLEDRQNIVVSRLNQLNDAVTRAKTLRVQKEALYNQVRAAATNGASADTISAIVQNSFIQSLKTRLAELQRDKVRLSERYGEKHPEILKINASLQDATRQLDLELKKVVESVRNEYQSALAEERTMAGALEEQKGAAMDLNRKSINYTVLEREAHSNRQVYESLLQREKELRVISHSRANNVRLMDRAEQPKAPFSPNIRRGWLMAVGVGLTLAIGLCFGLDYINDTIKTPEDITSRLKLPFLGLVPSIRGERHPMLSGPVPHDFGEAFRALRTAMVMSNGTEGPKTVAVTSAQPLEGKTTTACNLALALAVGGSRVLLVDADMRRPGVHKALRIGNDRGLSHLLVGQARVRDVIQRTQDPHLLVITAGRTPSNPSELLASDRMKAMLANLAKGPFDWVIIDTPPVLAVTDAVILAPAVSGVMFVLGAEMTRRRLAERAIETLLASRPRLIGTVLNKVDFNRNRYYYSRYYGHQYKSYYTQTSAAI
jgi:capsular exopolysaccharide synthesis family protein